MKKVLFLIFTLVMCLSLCACGSDSSSTNESEKITTHHQAINLVKNGGARYEICQDLSFKDIVYTEWGSCTAGKNSDGTWTVELCGTMCGYTDKYHQETETYSFEYTVTIDAEGSVNWGQGKTKKIN